MCCSFGDLVLGVLAIIFPPFPVWVRRGICSADSLINILLCLLGYLPGLVHAWYIIAITPSIYEDMYYQDLERQGNGHSHGHGQTHVYYYVDSRGEQHPQHGLPKPGNTPNYGTAGSAPGSQPSQPSQPQHQSQSSAQPQPQQPEAGPSHDNGEGSTNAGPPPTYADAVKGDHKIQSDE